MKINFYLPKILKYITLLLVFSLLLLIIQSAIATREFQIAIFLVLALILIAITYLSSISVPLKFFLPGILFLTAFVIAPILYTVVMSTFKYQTGNYISKEESIERIKLLATTPDESGTTFDIVLGKYDNQFAVLASNPIDQQYFISTPTNKINIGIDQVDIDENGVALKAPNFDAATVLESSELDQQYSTIRFKYEGDYFILLEGSSVGAVVRQSFNYNQDADRFENLIDDQVYTDNGAGNFANINDPEDVLQPGWRSPIWFSHYMDIVRNEKVRDPLISVFIWTVVFASLTVLTQFGLGLLVAMAMNKAIRGRKIYRSIFILPYAMPSIMSILIWAGMFNTEFGAINTLFNSEIAWFQNPNFSRFAVILVNLWLGFPYFYLITSGAMQAIPGELSEAAQIDGATPRQVFSRITLPLLLKIVSPLLVASFAFNFNNFNLIYLLTGGGPRNDLDGEVAGATDILISYTYRIAFGTNVQDLGFASAISVIIFFIVATISLFGIRKSKVLDSFS
jgi:arabinogalactan oligomer/maltooligosaccharide transport system permease protein